MTDVRIVLIGEPTLWGFLPLNIELAHDDYCAKLESAGIEVVSSDTLEHYHYHNDVVIQNTMEKLPCEVRPIMTFTLRDDDITRMKLMNRDTNSILFDNVTHQMITPSGEKSNFSVTMEVITIPLTYNAT